jgi:hypothetical protein
MVRFPDGRAGRHGEERFGEWYRHRPDPGGFRRYPAERRRYAGPGCFRPELCASHSRFCRARSYGYFDSIGCAPSAPVNTNTFAVP